MDTPRVLETKNWATHTEQSAEEDLRMVSQEKKWNQEHYQELYEAELQVEITESTIQDGSVRGRGPV